MTSKIQAPGTARDAAPVSATSRAAVRGIAGSGLPAMPESPIPDLAPRNRTPDPTARYARPEPAEARDPARVLAPRPPAASKTVETA